MNTQNVNESSSSRLSGIMTIGTEGLKQGKYVKLSTEKQLVLHDDKKGKLTLLEIGKIMSDIAQNGEFSDVNAIDLVKIKTGMEKLKDKLTEIQKNNPIKTFFLNLFTFGRYGKSVRVYNDTINFLENKIPKNININESNQKKTQIKKNEKVITKITKKKSKSDVKTSTKELKKTAPLSITENVKELKESKKSQSINMTNKISMEKLENSTNTTTSIKTNSISQNRHIKRIQKESELKKPESTKPKIEIPATEKERIDSFIEKIGNEVRDGLVSDEKEIDQKVSKFINEISITGNKKDEFDKKLQVAKNKAFIQRELKQKGKLVSGDTDESLLIKYFVGKNEGNKEQIYLEIKNEIEKLDPKIIKISLSQIKEQIKQIALKARLHHAGIKDELQIKKFQQALPVLKDLHEKLDNFAEEKKLPLIKGLGKDSPNFRFLEKEFDVYKNDKIQDYLKHNLTKAKLNEDQIVLNAFNNKECSSEKFQEILNSLKIRIKEKIKTPESDINKAISPSNDKFQQEIKEKVQFLNKWGGNFTNEMVQGLDNPNEALDEGICFGLCQDLQMSTLENPTISLKELSDRQISGMKELNSEELKKEFDKAKKENRPISEQTIRHSKPRFLQGIHMASKKGFLPENVGLLPKYRVKEENSFFVLDFSKEETRIQSKEKIKNEYNNVKKELNVKHGATDIRLTEKNQLFGDLKKHIDEGVEKGLWKESNGWMRIGLEGEQHTIAVRIDKERNKVWLFDPNFGYLSFNENDFSNNKNKCLECLNELLKIHYPKTFAAGVYALKKLPKQK